MKRQYRGAVGKHTHRQAGVFPGYASRYGSTRLDRRLYLSQEWIEDVAYAAWPAGSARTLINCLNTGSQKARQCRGMCSESVKHFLYVAQSIGQTPPCPPGSTSMC